MNKKKKWTLVITGVLVVVLIVITIVKLPMIKILLGTKELSKSQEKIPNIISGKQPPLTKGSADWPSWYGPNGDKISNVSGIKK